MRRVIVRRVLVALATSLSVPVVLTVALPPVSASAAGPTIVACGNLSLKGADDTLAKCNHPGITGSGASMELAAGYFTITWKTKGITSGEEVPTEVKQSQCPPNFKSELKLLFTVTYSTNKTLVGGETINFVCLHSDGAGRLLPGTKFTV